MVLGLLCARPVCCCSEPEPGPAQSLKILFFRGELLSSRHRSSDGICVQEAVGSQGPPLVPALPLFSCGWGVSGRVVNPWAQLQYQCASSRWGAGRQDQRCPWTAVESTGHCWAGCTRAVTATPARKPALRKLRPWWAGKHHPGECVLLEPVSSGCHRRVQCPGAPCALHVPCPSSPGGRQAVPCTHLQACLPTWLVLRWALRSCCVPGKGLLGAGHMAVAGPWLPAGAPFISVLADV